MLLDFCYVNSMLQWRVGVRSGGLKLSTLRPRKRGLSSQSSVRFPAVITARLCADSLLQCCKSTWDSFQQKRRRNTKELAPPCGRSWIISAGPSQFFALETGQEPAAALLRFIQDVDRQNVKVNFDPVNFLIYDTDAPLTALEVLKDYVVGVHCKDARRPSRKGDLREERPWRKERLGPRRS